MKLFVGLVGLAALGFGAAFMFWSAPAPGSDTMNGENATSTSEAAPKEDISVVAPGAYTVDAAKSTFDWSAKKPLIEGYINSGTIGLKEGSFTVTETAATGGFVLDMNTLKVGLTATKPGKEGALETHLKSKDFFEVTKFPTAEFKIKTIAPQADTATTFVYTVTGDLTMKGKTNEISFPAQIYWKENTLQAHGQTEIDRTKWGITYGSGNFFKTIGDNAIADNVAIAFHLVATKNQ